MDKEKRICKIFEYFFFVNQKISYFLTIFLHLSTNFINTKIIYFRIKLYSTWDVRSTDGFALEQQKIKEEKLRKIIRLSDFP